MMKVNKSDDFFILFLISFQIKDLFKSLNVHYGLLELDTHGEWETALYTWWNSLQLVHGQNIFRS